MEHYCANRKDVAPIKGQLPVPALVPVHRHSEDAHIGIKNPSDLPYRRGRPHGFFDSQTTMSTEFYLTVESRAFTAVEISEFRSFISRSKSFLRQEDEETFILDSSRQFNDGDFSVAIGQMIIIAVHSYHGQALHDINSFIQYVRLRSGAILVDDTGDRYKTIGVSEV
jgi:hypothetical protein